MTAVLESPPPQKTTCTTADPGAVADFIASAHGICGRVEGLRSDRPITLSHVVMGPISLCTVRIPGELSFEAAPGPCFVVAHVMAGSMHLGADTHTEVCRAGDTVLAIRPGRTCRARLVDAEVSLTALTPDVLAEITGDLDRGPVRFTSGRPRSAPAAAQWQTAVDYVATTLADRVGAGGYEQVAAGAVRLLAATMLQVFPNTFADAGDVSVDTMDTWPPMLRRSVEFMHANCARDIGMTDVARALNVTPRAVQYLFRRHLDVSPMTYLRRIRLRRAHRDLMAADPAKDTVAAIAVRWGFAHTGRFSQAYRAEFGQAPSVTLRG